MSALHEVVTTTFRPCAVIPNYNHTARLEQVVEQVLAAGLPCILVNDGSDASTRAALEALAAAHPTQLELLHHEVNKGKGGAVKTGLVRAYERGFTHALQIDADGQHNAEDIPKFLNAAKRHPEALVLGRPIFDESIPKGRLYPRYITHVWVWIETLSLEIKDSMCGFRVYPLAATYALFERETLGDRMDFDIEIAVRMFWQNVPFVSVDTEVKYHQDGVSHFRMWLDNVLISWLHTRLFLGMLLRLPWLLLRRRARVSHATHWSRMPERGAAWGIRFVLGMMRLLGRRAAGVGIYPIIGYFYLTGREAKAASIQYLQRLYDTPSGRQVLGQPPSRWTSFRHFLSFGRAVIDKLAAWSGEVGLDEISWPNRQLLLDQMATGKGAVLFSAHLGNIELLRALGESIPELKMNVLVFTEHAERFNAVVRALNPGSQISLIPVNRISVETGMLLKERVERGELVAVLADRISERTLHRSQQVPFLGHPAAFPEGPFILASILQCPTYLLFCLRRDDGRYDVHLEPFEERIELPRKRRREVLHQVIAKFAARLEAHCLLAPLQWFNFYDFWQAHPSQRENVEQEH